MALVSFMPVTEEITAVGAIRASSKERKALAAKSVDWRCKECGKTNQEIADEHMLPYSDEQAEKELASAESGPMQLSGFAPKKEATPVNKEATSAPK